METSKTMENLKEAFTGESQANRRYLAFASAAEEEGYPQVAKLLRAAAAAETVHAHNHLRAMGGVKSTRENIMTALDGETYEFKTMYPGFLADAAEEGESQARWSLKIASEVERIHASLYRRAAEALERSRDLPQTEFYVCTVCGNTVENAPPERCPICDAPAESFSKVA